MTLQRQYLLSMAAIALLLLLALSSYGWYSLSDRRADIRASIQAQSEQLQVSIDDKIDLVRGHLFSMRRAIEDTLARPDLADSAVAERLLRGVGAEIDTLAADGEAVDPATLTLNVGALVARPGTQPGPNFRRNLAAAAAFLEQAAGNHQWYRIFEWSYFYDAHERWFLIYPHLSRRELLEATATRDLNSALDVFFDAHGTQPVALVGPRQNPERAMIWTPPYEDAGGKGMMVTLLAPVYLTDEYIGAVGADVTLKTLSAVLRAHAPEAGRALVIDQQSQVLADVGDALEQSDRLVALSSLFPGADLDGPDWLKLPIAHTPWTLVVHLDAPAMRNLMTQDIRLYLGVALLLVLAIVGIGVFQSRRYAGPALRLAAFVEDCESRADIVAPKVPAGWAPLFERVARITRERRELLRRTQAHAEELEVKVAERTAELQRTNDSLEQTVATLRDTQRDLVRADRLGALGGLIAGVANELHGPLAQAAGTSRQFLARLDAFRAQVTRGLRKAELEAFITQADRVARQVGEEIDASVELLGRFKQLAVDQASEQARRFRLHEVAENVLAAMRPVLSWRQARVDNRIPAEIEMHAQAGVLGQALHHLLTDALERADQVGKAAEIALSATPGNDERGAYILLSLTDTARAPAAADESARSGLALARTLIRDASDGDIEARVTDTGTRISLRLPQTIG